MRGQESKPMAPNNGYPWRLLFGLRRARPNTEGITSSLIGTVAP
jgi:hypothetical protein